MSLDKPMDHKDRLEKILDGLRSEYKFVIDSINGRDTPIFFDELHEKLINKEITLQQQHSLSFVVPATANPIAPTDINSSGFPHGGNYMSLGNYKLMRQLIP